MSIENFGSFNLIPCESYDESSFAGNQGIFLKKYYIGFVFELSFHSFPKQKVPLGTTISLLTLECLHPLAK